MSSSSTHHLLKQLNVLIKDKLLVWPGDLGLLANHALVFA